MVRHSISNFSNEYFNITHCERDIRQQRQRNDVQGRLVTVHGLLYQLIYENERGILMLDQVLTAHRGLMDDPSVSALIRQVHNLAPKLLTLQQQLAQL